MPCCLTTKRFIIAAYIICSIHCAVIAQTDIKPILNPSQREGLINTQTVSNQPANDTLTAINISSKAITGLQKKYSNLQERLSKQSAKLLSRMQAREDRLHSKLQNTDSTKAQEIFTDDVQQRYAALKNKLSDTTALLKRFPLKEYVPGLDSMQTGLSFLLKNKNLPLDKIQQLQALSTKLKGLESELQKANDIQAFVREREAELKEQLLNSGFAKQLTGINKQVYYYQTELSQYKEMLNDKEKLKEKILETVRTFPAFQKFWQKNSYLAALFPAPVNLSASQALAGLQTRSSIQNLIAQRVGTGGTGVSPLSGGAGMDYFEQQVSVAQTKLDQLKNKLILAD